MPGPLNEAALVRLALSNEDLKTSLMPKLSARISKHLSRDVGPSTQLRDASSSTMGG
jgi:hypothetical protein